MQTDYPIDLDAIKEIGIEKWLSSNIPPNPVITFYQSIYKHLFSLYWNICPQFSENSEYYFLFATNYKIVNSLSDRIIKYLLYQKLKSLGYKRILVKKYLSIEIDDAIQNLISLKNEQSINHAPENNFIKEALIQLRLQWKSCKKFSLFPFFITSSNVPNYVILGDIRKKEFQLLIKNQIANFLFPLRTQILIPFSSAIVSQKDKNDLSHLLKIFFDELTKLFPEEKILFNEKLFNSHLILFFHTFTLIKSTQKKLKSLAKNELFVFPHGNYLYRIVASAWRLAGGITSSFTHGYPFWVPQINYSDWHNGSYSIFDRIFVFSKHEMQVAEKYRNSHPKINFPQPYFLEGFYSELIKKNLDEKPITEIKRILLIGFPMDYINYYSIPYHNTFIQLKLELQTLKILKNHHFYTCYKAHPDTKSETLNFFDDYADDVNYEPFEIVYNQTDCLVFGSPFTTTFGFSLLTRKPIVCFDTFSDYYPWGKEITTSLANRVAFVKVTINDIGEVNFSKECLLTAIQDSLHKATNCQEIIDFFL